MSVSIGVNWGFRSPPESLCGELPLIPLSWNQEGIVGDLGRHAIIRTVPLYAVKRFLPRLVREVEIQRGVEAGSITGDSLAYPDHVFRQYLGGFTGYGVQAKEFNKPEIVPLPVDLLWTVAAGGSMASSTERAAAKQLLRTEGTVFDRKPIVQLTIKRTDDCENLHPATNGDATCYLPSSLAMIRGWLLESADELLHACQPVFSAGLIDLYDYTREIRSVNKNRNWNPKRVASLLSFLRLRRWHGRFGTHQETNKTIIDSLDTAIAVGEAFIQRNAEAFATLKTAV